MNPELTTVLTEREAMIARLRAAYGFSEVEASDFIDRFGDVYEAEHPAQHEARD